MSKLTELQGRLDERRSKLAEAFEQAGPDYDFSKVTNGVTATDVKSMNDEMTKLGEDIDEIRGNDAIKARLDEMGELEELPLPTGTKGEQRRREEQAKSIGDLFVESDAFKNRVGGGTGPETELKNVDMDELLGGVKTTFSQTSWVPIAEPRNNIVPLATRPIMVSDLFPKGATSASSITYYEETTFTNAAAETTEAAAKPEAALALTLRTEVVRKIAVFLPVTDETLEDEPRARSYVNNRLGFMVQQRLDAELLVGDGTPPNISGIEDRSGVQTQALGADSVPDAVYKAMTLIRVNAFSEPNAAVFHPNDWQDVRLLTTTDGIYIWGPPYDAGPERIWGLRVVQSTAQTENTALVGDFNQTELVMRQGLTVQVGYNNDDWTKNKQTIRAELRAALAVYRPAAFATVTGI